jgi:hypothetical protein
MENKQYNSIYLYNSRILKMGQNIVGFQFILILGGVLDTSVEKGFWYGYKGELSIGGKGLLSLVVPCVREDL